MSAIIIKTDSKSSKLLEALAKRLGGDVISIKDSEYEEFVFGKMIAESKTGRKISREEVFRELSK